MGSEGRPRERSFCSPGPISCRASCGASATPESPRPESAVTASTIWGRSSTLGGEGVVIDFEGEPARSLRKRRLKRSSLRNVAGMLRSYHYASVFGLRYGQPVRPENRSRLERWDRVWYRAVSGAFLKGYLETTVEARFLPRARDGRAALLEIFLLEKAACELRYELNNEPERLRGPVEGLLELLDHNSRGKP